MIGGAFGTLWVVVALSALPRYERALPRIAILVAGITLVWFALDFRKHFRDAAGPQSPTPRSKKMTVLVLVEAAFIFAGARFFDGIEHHQSWFIAYLLFVVGAHFLPMAQIQHAKNLVFLGLGMCLCGIGAGLAIVAEVGRAWWLGVPCGAAGACLLISALVGIVQVGRDYRRLNSVPGSA